MHGLATFGLARCSQAIIFRKVGNERKGPRLLDEARETELKVGWVKVRVASPLFLTSNLQCSGDGSIERTATNLKATHTFKSATVVSAPKQKEEVKLIHSRCLKITEKVSIYITN